MVGRPLSNKVSVARESHNPDIVQPPPPYDSVSSNPLILAETTTTRTEVVTTTTTHFFSLPLWRKRGLPTSGSSRENSLIGSSIDANEHGLIPPSIRSGAYMVEKDLPPTPPNELEPVNGDYQGLHQTEKSVNRLEESSMASAQVRNQRPFTADAPVARSTVALARAALGLGLPHVLPYASTPTSSTEINTVPFTSVPLQDGNFPSASIRRAKSSQKFRSVTRPNKVIADDFPMKDEPTRRTRRFSLGSTSALDLNLDSKGKGKEREQIEQSPAVVSRRASFWSRRRTIAPEPVVLSAPRDGLGNHLAPLPPLQPVSPFNMEMTIKQSPLGQDDLRTHRHAHGLSRSHSDHAPNSPEFDSALAILHPAEADSAINFTVVQHTPNTTVKPGTSFPQIQAPDRSQTLESLSRPRAHTNPPLSLRTLFSGTPLSPSSYASSPETVIDPARVSLNRDIVNVPLPKADTDSPEVYLQRLQSAVSKAEVAGILASSADPFHVKVLQTYIGRFNFVDDPLDVALRKLLMEVGLPRETQQIDRVIEAFAGRYLKCNPTLFISEDHPYILAFSLIMLHTDAFNKSNKRKMTKIDYIKNTKLPGVPSVVLDCFYDNILFAPFIFIEDPLDVNGQRGVTPEPPTPSRLLTPSGNVGNAHFTGQGLIRSTKIDPYYLISNNLLNTLRVDVETYVPSENPYSYQGTVGSWDEESLQRAFAKAGEIEVGADQKVYPLLSMSGVGNTGSPVRSPGAHPNTSTPGGKAWTLKITKIGLLNRKDDFLEGGKKASNRKWKSWSVILTGSQLLFFRDSSWSTTLMSQTASPDGRIIYPHLGVFKPDELLSVKDAIAVFDRSYTKHENTLRFVLSDGRQLLLQTSDERELNEWIARINYASAFKSAGVRMRPLDMSGVDVKLTGVAAATSHLHDLQQRFPKFPNWDGEAPRDLMGMLSEDPNTETKTSSLKHRLKIITVRDDVDVDVPVAPEVEGADQFKATFDQVKADLAAGRWAPPDEADSSFPSQESLERSVDSTTSPPMDPQTEYSPLPSRAQIMQSKVHDLESRIAAAQSQLDADMRLVRNIATLTPFQKSTRDRLATAAQGMAKRIMQVRLETTKLICHRYVLLNDLASQERSWHRVKTLALKAATETLQTRGPGIIPRMTLSFHHEPSDVTPSNGPLLDTSTPLSHRPESSICGSFHSALDFGTDWTSSEDITSPTLLRASPVFDSPERNNSRPPSPLAAHEEESASRSPSSDRRPLPTEDAPTASSKLQHHERFYTAHEIPEEQAEFWDKTRCAQRVSLVRVPSDMQMSTRFQRFHNDSDSDSQH